MLSLTTAITIPNIQKIKVIAVALDGENNVASVTCSVQGSGGKIYTTVTLAIRDGASQGLRATVAPIGYQDIVEAFTNPATPTAFTDLVSAYTGGISNRNKAAETALVAAGLLPAGTVA